MNPDPFPHIIIDWWFDRELLEAVAAEFPLADQPGWKQYRNGNEGKYEGAPSMWGLRTFDYFDELEAHTDDLAGMFGIDDLSMETIGGGYHLIPPGGHLQMHTDFNRSPNTGLYRRLNVLTFLNDRWDDPGGLLYLGANREVTVVPEMGRTVAFATSDTSWHGHPEPASRWRRSLAAYFFAPTLPPGYHVDHSTVWLETADA